MILLSTGLLLVLGDYRLCEKNMYIMMPCTRLRVKHVSECDGYKLAVTAVGNAPIYSNPELNILLFH
jgi:hypothetical protein